MNEGREFSLGLPERTEGWFFERFGATGERDGGRRMYMDYVGDDLSKDLVNREGPVGHDGGASRNLSSCRST